MTQNPASANGGDRPDYSAWPGQANDGLSAFAADAGGDVTHARVSALLDDVTVQDLSMAESEPPVDTETAAATELPADTETAATAVPPAALEVVEDAEYSENNTMGEDADRMLAPIASTKETAPTYDSEIPGAGDQVEAVEEPAEHDASSSSNINIKGRTDGLSIEVGFGDWTEALGDLDVRLRESAGFFRGAHVALDLGTRSVDMEDLAQVRAMLSTHEMVLSLVRTESENTFQATLDLGLAGVMDSAGVEQASAQIAETNEPEQGQFVYRGNLRSGQVLRRSEDVVVLGDVNPGAEIVSDGNILIWGRLRGIAHAGADGDRDKIVGALLMEPVQVRIADLVGVSANEGGRLFGRRNKRRGATPAAEIASVDSDRIVTGSWDTVRSYSLSSRRR